MPDPKYRIGKLAYALQVIENVAVFYLFRREPSDLLLAPNAAPAGVLPLHIGFARILFRRADKGWRFNGIVPGSVPDARRLASVAAAVNRVVGPAGVVASPTDFLARLEACHARRVHLDPRVNALVDVADLAKTKPRQWVPLAERPDDPSTVTVTAEAVDEADALEAIEAAMVERRMYPALAAWCEAGRPAVALTDGPPVVPTVETLLGIEAPEAAEAAPAADETQEPSKEKKAAGEPS
ncbi:MAG TPA: hypothetical protein VMW48_10665 [Vicinamibacterales bacterium]|nr:hypothetical protein [Vicinamibacterales bacterium]